MRISLSYWPDSELGDKQWSSARDGWNFTLAGVQARACA